MQTLGHIVRSADFARVLRTPPRTRSAHFVVHHLVAAPSRARPRLSTGLDTPALGSVDDLPGQAWLGAVVPKRYARRAVTRNAVRRAVRETALHRQPPLAHGLWIVRLNGAFDRARFVSATSDALVSAVRAELVGLLARVG